MKKLLILYAICFSVISSYSQTDKQQEDSITTNDNSWEFNLTPYAYMAGLSGDIIFETQSIPVDASFSDLLNNLSFGAMFHGEATKNKWTLMTDLVYMKLKKDGELLNENVKIKAALEQLVFEIGAGYTFHQSENFTIDAIAGIRYFDLNSVITFVAINERILDKGFDFTDPYIGARYKTQLKKWKNSARIDIGGFGLGSEFSWKFNVVFGYEISKLVSLHLGYQGYSVDYKEDSFNYDIFTGGAVLGANFNF